MLSSERRGKEEPSDGQAAAGAEYRVGDKIRQVTDVHSNWSSQGPLENGKFSYQLILDNGAEEALIMPTADDAKVFRDFFADADSVYWDTEKQVLIFGKIQ